MVDMSVKIGSVTLKNPIMPASGAFSTELAQVMDINRLGALVTKTVSREYRIGNPPPRVAELEGGMINSIGLPGKGIKYFLEHQLPEYKRYTPPIVANITATTADDFAAKMQKINDMLTSHIVAAQNQQAKYYDRKNTLTSKTGLMFATFVFTDS